jgi:hypothetical protein
MGKSVAQTQINSLTVSRTVQEWLCEGPLAGRVLAVFDHACDLLIPDERIVALVTPKVGAGPINVVVEDSVGLFSSLVPDMPVTMAGREIQVGRLTVSLRKAAVWEPRPDWIVLHARRSTILDHLPDLHAPCLERVPIESLLILLRTPPGDAFPSGGTLATARQTLDALRAGWAGDRIRLWEGVEQMAGLGSGLTPGGDDFLIGVMLWAWLAHPAPVGFCRTVAEAAAGRTTTLSAAILRAAARGECSIAWHALLEAASQGADAKVAQAVEGVLAHGAASGADALAGFMWAALLPPPSPAAPGRFSPLKAADR